LADKYKKPHISAREFVDSWEKEIYELSNMDYFIFLLINTLASEIESQFFSRLNPASQLYLQSNDIGTLSFSIGDSLQLFFEENCFSACGLKCPANFDENVPEEQRLSRLNIQTASPAKPQPCRSREECLYFDILNYVVFDSLLDFYSSEMSVSIGEENTEFIELAEAIMKILLAIIRNEGSRLLQEPGGLCGYLFDKLLKKDYDPWEERGLFMDEEIDESEGEEWKDDSTGPQKVFSEYLQLKNSLNETDIILLKKFQDYIVEFLDICSIVELSIEDIKEFFTVAVVNESVLENNYSIGPAAAVFSDFYAYLDYNFKTEFKNQFEEFSRSMLPEIERAFNTAGLYKKKNPLIEHLLSADKSDPSLIDGFFEVCSIPEGISELEDIHLKLRFPEVKLAGIDIDSLKTGDVLHAQLIKKEDGWQLIHLEMIYPKSAKDFLF